MRPILLCLLTLVLFLQGCSTLPNGRRWGEDATLTPGWERIGTSAQKAVTSPWTWAPLAGAALLQIDHCDRRVSEWAVRTTPVFGSRQRAADASDLLANIARWSSAATLVATPGGDDPWQWTVAKTKGYLVEFAAKTSTRESTFLLKNGIGRTRPSGEDQRSMPSGHASRAAVFAAFAGYNLEAIEMPDAARTSLQAGLVAVTLGTGWARVESANHYPADTLVGMALGHFFAVFISDAFLGLDSDVAPVVTLSRAGAMLGFSMRY